MIFMKAPTYSVKRKRGPCSIVEGTGQEFYSNITPHMILSDNNFIRGKREA